MTPKSRPRVPPFWPGLLAAALALLGCSERPVTVGAVLPLSGEHAVYGRSLNRGMEAAVAEVNRGGGIQGRTLEVEVRDTGSDSQAAADRFRELVDGARVPVVLGGATSGETLAMAPLAEAYHRVLLSPSASSPLITDAGDFVFRVWPSDLLEASVMADFAAYTLRALKVLVISSESPYAEGLRSAFAERFAGPQRRVEVLVSSGRVEDWPGIAAQARGLRGQAHCIYLVGYEGELVGAISALRKAGLDMPMLTVSAASNAEFPARLGPEAEGILFPRPRYEPGSKEEPVLRFTRAFRERYGEEPDIYAAHAYDAVMVLSSVMAAQGTRPESVQRGLLAVRNFSGASGSITFDARGDVVQPIQICVVHGGAVRPLAEVQDQVLPPLQRRVEGLRFGRR